MWYVVRHACAVQLVSVHALAVLCSLPKPLHLARSANPKPPSPRPPLSSPSPPLAGATISTQLSLPILQEQLDNRALEAAADRAKVAESEIIRMEVRAEYMGGGGGGNEGGGLMGLRPAYYPHV